VFDLNEAEEGMTLPPRHPNCRCTTVPYFDDEFTVDETRAARDENGKTKQIPADMTYDAWEREFAPADYQRKSVSNMDMEAHEEWLDGYKDHGLSFEEWKKRQTQEKERAYIHDDGKRDAGHVNLALVNTKKYHDKFENLSNHKAVNESLYQESMVILGDRNNTEYEDIVAVDARSGKVLEKNTSAAQCGYKHSCGFTLEQYQGLEKRGEAYEVLHNHPNSSVPSRDDIRKLFERDKQMASTICCHNGDVYRLEKLKPFESIADMEKKVYIYTKEKFNGFPDDKIEYECSMTMIYDLSRKGYLKFTKR